MANARRGTKNTKQESVPSENAPHLIVWTVREGDGKDKKAFWIRIGSAWECKGDGYSVVLDALPVNGRIVLFPPKDKDDNDAR